MKGSTFSRRQLLGLLLLLTLLAVWFLVKLAL
jgi:hypothetical protein